MKRRAQPWLGTMVEISIADAMTDIALAIAFEQAFQSIALVHRLMSFHAADSDIRRINHADVGAIVEINVHTYHVLQTAMQISDASAGLFDIRIAGRLMEWALLPATEQARALCQTYQAQKTAFTLTVEGTLKKQRADWLDVGGIAKGYAVDQAIQSLQQCGVRQACVNAGGDLRVIGDDPIDVLLRDPAHPSSLVYKISLQNQALATSASYFSLVQTTQGSYSALVHGQTGAAMLDKVSVSVVAPQCILADALTKVVMASADADHACLTQFDAQAFII